MNRFPSVPFGAFWLWLRRLGNSIYSALILRLYWQFRPSPIKRDGILGLIGNTPMIELISLSNITGCRILAKLEYMNPSGSPKDRIVMHFFNNLVKDRILSPPGSSPEAMNRNTSVEIVEGSTGSTGISLACISRKFNSKCTIFMPSDQSPEKQKWMRLFGARVVVTPPASFIDPEHYSKQAESYAKLPSQTTRIFFDQFENLNNNVTANYESTAPEIWSQAAGNISAIVFSAGGSGTVVGVSKYLKEQRPDIKVFLAGPQHSGVHSCVNTGVSFPSEGQEGARSKHQVGSAVQDVEINRLGSIVAEIPRLVDDYIKINDSEVIEMATFLLYNECIYQLKP